VRERPVTFTCRECGETVTESRRPGQWSTPRWQTTVTSLQ